MHRLPTLDEVRVRIEDWRQECNGERSHGSLRRRTPNEVVVPMAGQQQQDEPQAT